MRPSGKSSGRYSRLPGRMEKMLVGSLAHCALNTTVWPSGENFAEGISPRRYVSRSKVGCTGFRNLPSGVDARASRAISTITAGHSKTRKPAPRLRDHSAFGRAQLARFQLLQHVFERDLDIRHALPAALRILAQAAADNALHVARNGRRRSGSAGTGSECSTDASVESLESPMKARLPVTISYNTAPNEKISDRASTVCPSACSGDM